MTRLKKRRKRIIEAITFYLQIVENGKWTSIQSIISHLDYTSRGRKSYNSITPSGLGQYMRQIKNAEKREVYILNSRSIQYRILSEDEEE